MGFLRETITVTTTGSAGSATGSTDSGGRIKGRVLAVVLNFHADAPSTTDTTVKTKGTHGASYNVLVVSNSATDNYFVPRCEAVDNTGLSIVAGNPQEAFLVDDVLTVAIAQSDALTGAVTADILYELV